MFNAKLITLYLSKHIKLMDSTNENVFLENIKCMSFS